MRAALLFLPLLLATPALASDPFVVLAENHAPGTGWVTLDIVGSFSKEVMACGRGARWGIAVHIVDLDSTHSSDAWHFASGTLAQSGIQYQVDAGVVAISGGRLQRAGPGGNHLCGGFGSLQGAYPPSHYRVLLYTTGIAASWQYTVMGPADTTFTMREGNSTFFHGAEDWSGAVNVQAYPSGLGGGVSALTVLEKDVQGHLAGFYIPGAGDRRLTMPDGAPKLCTCHFELGETLAEVLGVPTGEITDFGAGRYTFPKTEVAPLQGGWLAGVDYSWPDDP